MAKNKNVDASRKKVNARLSALESYDIIDSVSKERFNNLTLIASEIFETPISLINIIDGEDRLLIREDGSDSKQIPRENSFCQCAIKGINNFIVEDTLEDERFVENLLVIQEPNIRFYAGHPLIDDAGRVLGTLCVIDYVPRKVNKHQSRALELLAKEVVSEIIAVKEKAKLEVYRKFFNLSLEFLCVLGTDSYFKKMNPTFAEKLGYTTEDLMAKPFTDFVHKDDLGKMIMEIHNLTKGYKSNGFENRFRKKDGTYIWLHWTCFPDPISGELFAAAHEVTSLKNAMSEIQVLQDKNQAELLAINSAVVRVELSPDRKVLNTNSNFTTLFGYGDEIINKNHSELLCEEDKKKEEYNQFWGNLLDNKIQHKEFRRKTKSGKTIWIKGSYIPVVDHTNKVKRIIKLAYDVTKEKELNEDILFLNKFQKGILDGTPQAIISTDKDGLIKSFNRGAENMLGYNAEDIIDKENPGIFHLPSEVVSRAKELSAELNENIEPGFEAFIAKTRKLNTPDEQNWTYVRKDGTQLPVWLSINCIRDDQNEIIGFIGISFDLSEQRRHVLEIEKINEDILFLNKFQKGILDGTPQAIISTDKDGLIKSFNRGAENMLGYNAEDIIDKENPGIFHLPSEVVNRAKELSAELNENIEPGFEAFIAKTRKLNTPDEQNWTYVRKDGTQLPVWLSINCIRDDQNEIIGFIGISFDLSEQKRHILEIEKINEDIMFLNKFQKGILDGTPQAIISTDKDGLIKSFNRGAENMLGYNAEDIIDKENPGIFHLPSEVVNRAKELSAELNENIEPGFEAFIAKTRKLNTPDEKNWTYVRKDGSELPVWLSINCIKDDQDEIIGYIGISFDLSEQQNNVLEIQKKNEELDQFAYIVSHDLKAPLRAISTLSTFLEEDLEGKLDDGTSETFKLLKSRVLRMQSLINGILEYSRIGKKVIREDKVDVNKLLIDVADSLDSNDSFEIKIQADLPTVIYNKIQLGQIFQNLISNGIKYHDKKKGIIDIKCHDKQNMYVFEVSDDGPGIEPQYHEKIFTIFQTLQARDDYESTGIGLSIAKKIVEEHGGEIWIKSVFGEGSTFFFSVPKEKN